MHGIGGVASIEAHEGGISDLDRYQQQWAETLDTINDRAAIKFNVDGDFDSQTKILKPDAPVYSPFVSHERSKVWS